MNPSRFRICSIFVALSCCLGGGLNRAHGHVTLDDPNGGEVLEPGTVFTIEWHIVIAHNLQNWDLWYSTSGPGGPWIVIAMNLPAGDPSVGSVHTYDWVIPDNPTTLGRVRVRMDNSATDYEDISNANFTIIEATDIAILSSEPTDGAIDARQPSEPDGSSATGWSSIVLYFDGDASSLVAEDFSVSQVGGEGSPPTVVAVIPSDADPTKVGLLLSDEIGLGAWTVITHVASDTSMRIGYLPADVNNDRLSNANDVLALIDFLNGVGGALEDYQTDTDRSGAANASDILRVIDLLNGAGVYDEWLGATLAK